MALPSSRTVIIAGAGIGGLTAALALARSGFRALVLEQTERLEETGAGIQLSPNATRILIGLGLADRLRPYVVAPTAIRVLGGRSGREIVRIPLGAGAVQRYGAPYWVIHRGDLQAALSDAAVQDLNVVIRLGMSLEDFATHPHGVTVSARGASGLWTEHVHALIAADGLWSTARARVASKTPPRFAGRTAWRALVPAAQLAPEFREPIVHLWFGRDAHLVHYPVKGSKLINVVVITADNWSRPGWSEPASRIDLLARLSSPHWAPQAHSVFRAPDAWLKWALYETEPLARFARGAAALLGDAAHAMLPFRGSASPGCRTTRSRLGKAIRRSGAAAPARCSGSPRATANAITAPAPRLCCGTRGCGSSAANGSCRITIGCMIGVHPPDCRSPDRRDKQHHDYGRNAFSDDDFRKSAQAGLACGAGKTVGAVAAQRRRTRRCQGRCNAAGAQNSGGRRDRHRHRRRAGTPALRAWLPRSGGWHRLQQADRDGNPQRSLQSDVPDRGRPAASARPRACPRSAARPRPH